MTYSVTGIEGFDVETGEKKFKPGKVRTNLDLIAKETKELGDKIAANSEAIKSNDKALSDEIVSFERIFLDMV